MARRTASHVTLRTVAPRGDRIGLAVALRAISIACFGPRVHTAGWRAWAGSLAVFAFLALLGAPLLSVLAPEAFVDVSSRLPALLTEVPAKALREEILFRAVPFYLLAIAPGVRGGPLVSPRAFVLLSAVVFVLAHEINFRWIKAEPLSLGTLATLFAFGLSTGALFVRQGHLVGCLAIHAGWNVLRFRLDMFASPGDPPLGLAAGFDFVEGNPWVVAASFTLAAWTLWPPASRPPTPLPKTDP
jgi:hypothetical protein